MRYSRMPPEKKKAKHLPAIIAGVLVLGAVSVYLIGANTVSDFLSQNVVAPVAALFTPDATPEPKTSTLAQETPQAQPTEEQNSTIIIPSNTVYAIQMGVFDEQENANAVATDAKNKGGAGYIIEDSGKRVILAGYPTEQEAKAVKENLATSQQMETAIYEIKSDSLEFAVQGKSEEITELENAIISYDTAQSMVYDLIISFDKSEKTQEQALAELQSIATTVEEAKKTVDGITKGVDNSIMDLVSMFEIVETSLRELSDSAGIELSSGMKNAYIGFAVQRQVMIEHARAALVGG